MSSIPKTMKALVKTAETESYEWQEIPVPEPQKGELLVKVTRASICGSDIALYKWNEVAKVIATVPFTPGHECVGQIVVAGPGCPPQYKIGKRVCCENHYYCGDCYQCNHDMRHICQNMKQYGHGRGTIHGGCSQYTIIPAAYAYLLKTDIDDDKACLLERNCYFKVFLFLSSFLESIWCCSSGNGSSPSRRRHCLSARMWPGRIICYWNIQSHGSFKDSCCGCI
eukprot:m.58182 g.58182  ORF g.58182 m.58182 type:complete len:225 (+) comp34797_c0_seq3:572-1246(+)